MRVMVFPQYRKLRQVKRLIKKSVSIKYTKGDYSPVITSSGKGVYAELINKIAAGSGVPVVESPELTEALSSLNPYEYVPENYWVVIAEILRFVYETGKQGKE